MSTTNASRPSSKPVRRGPAPGKGKQRKVFPEEQGISHLLSLSNAIAGVTADKLDAKAQSNKVKRTAIEAKKKEDQIEREDKERRKRENQSRTGAGRVKSKAEIKAALKTSLREKSKSRKEARRLKNKASDATSSADAAMTKDAAQKKPKRKSVSFALP